MNDLLKVLDMSEDEQRQALLNLLDEETIEWFVDYDMHIADLAVRLWKDDEVISNPYLYDAMIDVHQAIEGPQDRKMDFVFWSMRAKPIHRIIAALKAKEQK